MPPARSAESASPSSATGPPDALIVEDLPHRLPHTSSFSTTFLWRRNWDYQSGDDYNVIRDPKTGACGSIVDLFADPRLNHHTAPTTMVK